MEIESRKNIRIQAYLTSPEVKEFWTQERSKVENLNMVKFTDSQVFEYLIKKFILEKIK